MTPSLGFPTLPATRAAARALAARHYFTGKPCRRRHRAPRLASNGHCTACHCRRIRARSPARTRRLLRDRFRQALLNGHGSSVLKYLALDLPTFRLYVESLFRDGMSWANYGRVWHLDHVRPLAAFDLRRPADRRVAFRYDNYQPLPVLENLKKGARLDAPAPAPAP